jgi:energy-converting hydrogenase Eha subunit A
MYIFVNILYSNETIITAIWLALVIDFFDIQSSKPRYYKYDQSVIVMNNVWMNCNEIYFDNKTL